MDDSFKETLDNLENEVKGALGTMEKRAAKKKRFAVISTISALSGWGLCAYWFGWRLFVVLFILEFAANVGRAIKDV